jgi:histone deacetylase complex regulatory component SIN3
MPRRPVVSQVETDVIHRVFWLFRGCPSLTQSYHLFLPWEYRVEYAEQGQEARLAIFTPGGGVVNHTLPLPDHLSIEDRLADPAGLAPLQVAAIPPSVAAIPRTMVVSQPVNAGQSIVELYRDLQIE